MESTGLDPSAWLTLLGVVVVFFVLPGTYLEVDRRRRLRRLRAAQRRTPGRPRVESSSRV